jgi:hypothetical protein
MSRWKLVTLEADVTQGGCNAMRRYRRLTNEERAWREKRCREQTKVRVAKWRERHPRPPKPDPEPLSYLELLTLAERFLDLDELFWFISPVFGPAWGPLDEALIMRAKQRYERRQARDRQRDHRWGKHWRLFRRR